MHNYHFIKFDIIHEKTSKIRQNKAFSLHAYFREKECILIEAHSIQILGAEGARYELPNYIHNIYLVYT